MTTEEMCDLLSTTKRNFKSILSRGKLDDRLIRVGYKLIKQYKNGKFNLYEIEKIEDLTWIQYQTIKNISGDKKDDHTKYTKCRITTGLKKPRSNVVCTSEANISNSTAKRYDEILIQDNVMEFDQTVYFIKNTETGEWEETTKEGYKMFWSRCSEATYYLNENYRRFKKGEIPRSTYEDTSYAIKDVIANKHGEIALKFNTYKEAENTKRILNMINNRYTNVDSYNNIIVR